MSQSSLGITAPHVAMDRLLFFDIGSRKFLNLENRQGVRMIEKASIIKDAIMTAAVIAVVVGALCYAAGGV